MRTMLMLAAGCAAMAATPARAEFSPLGDDGFVARHTETVAASPAEAWAVLIEPSGWWNGAHSFSGDAENLTLDPRAGGCFCEMLPVGENRSEPGSVRHLNVLFADPGTAIRLSGALGPLQSEPVGAVLTITFKPVEGGTRILFEYVVGGTMRFPVDQIGPAVDRVIGEQLSRLAALIGPLEAGPEAVPLPASAAAEEALTQREDSSSEPEAADRDLGADFLDGLEGDGEDAPPPAADREPMDEFDTR